MIIQKLFFNIVHFIIHHMLKVLVVKTISILLCFVSIIALQRQKHLTSYGLDLLRLLQVTGIGLI
jgi:hypothetical protein